MRSSVSSVRHVGSLNGLAGGLGDLVLNRGADNLGHGVAVLNLNRDELHLGVVHAVLGGNLATGVLDGSLDWVSYSVSNRGNMVGSIASEELRIGFSVSLGFTLAIVTSVGNRGCGSITQGVNNLLADLLIFNLFGINNLGVADIFSRWDAGLCYENLNIGDAVSSRHRSSVIRSS
jgi:hypothetical protein